MKNNVLEERRQSQRIPLYKFVMVWVWMSPQPHVVMEDGLFWRGLNLEFVIGLSSSDGIGVVSVVCTLG